MSSRAIRLHRGHGEPLTPEDRLHLAGLTVREAEAAILAARGFDGRGIAERMTVEEGTVKALLARARGKLECRDVRELAFLLLREGVVPPEEIHDPVGPRLDEAQ